MTSYDNQLMTKLDLHTGKRSTIQGADVLAVIRAPLEQYPPSLNQVKLLAQAGLRVAVVDTQHSDYSEYPFPYQENVLRFHVGPHVQLFKERSPNLLVRMIRGQLFHRRTQSLIRRLKPKVVIAYDPNGMEAVGRIWNCTRPPILIWHFHELFLNSKATGFFTRRAIRFSSEQANQADTIVFPDRHRADFFCNENRTKSKPLIVMNCPPRLDILPENTLPQHMTQFGVSPQAPIIYFQGWIGPSRCFEAIIQSMPHWPADAVLVLVGPVASEYRDQLQSLANTIGVKSRVIFIAAVPYKDLAGLTVGATLGLSILSDAVEKDLSWKFSAGSTNKRFEYMSVGVPQVANQGPGMQEIIEQTGAGALVNPTDPSDIGQTIARLLKDRILLQAMSINARQAHLTQYCLEKQCRDLMAQIQQAVQTEMRSR